MAEQEEKDMHRTQYSLSAHSPRWWWPSAALGAVALAAVVTVPVAAGHASPVDRLPASDERPPSDRVELSGATHGWWTVDCPAPPDARYVGVPWVPYDPTGCRSIDRWWTTVDR